MKKSLFDDRHNPLLSSDQVASLRIFCAFIFLFPFAVRKLKLLFSKDLIFILIAGITGNVIPAFLFTWAQTQLNSSMAGILNMLVPIFAVSISVLFFRRKISRKNLVGLGIACLGGVLLISLQGISTSVKDIPYMLMIVVATICYAISLNTIKEYLGKIKPLDLTAITFVFLGPPLGIYFFSTGIVSDVQVNPELWKAIGYTALLAFMSTAIALVVFNYLINLTTTVFSSSVTYLIPIVAIVWGLLDNETITAIQIGLSGLILSGVYLLNHKQGVK